MFTAKNDKTLILLTGYACNNNCIICSLRSLRQGGINRSTEEITSDLENGRRRGFLKAEFTGGEAGIRKDIFQLIRYAKTLGFKEIGMSTNGRMFYYPDICEKFIKSGLNRINISIYGHTPKLHNAVTRTPGSFEQTIKAIKNIKKFPFVTLEPTSVISKINYKHLNQLSYFLFDSIGVKRWSILDLIPDGNAHLFYNRLSIKLLDLSEKLVELSEKLPKAASISFFDFALCIFPPFMRNLNSYSFMVAKQRDEISEQIGYNPTRIKKINNNYIDKYKIRVLVCKKCKFETQCGGVWAKYIELYGNKEISILAKKNKCIRNNH